MADANATLEGWSLSATPGVIGKYWRVIGPFFRTDAAAVASGFTARIFAGIGFMRSGPNSISGVTNSAGAPVRRLVVVMTQPPRSVIVYEGYSDAATGSFTFPFLPAGNYVVLDTDPDGSNVAQVFDWVVSG